MTEEHHEDVEITRDGRGINDGALPYLTLVKIKHSDCVKTESLIILCSQKNSRTLYCSYSITVVICSKTKIAIIQRQKWNQRPRFTHASLTKNINMALLHTVDALLHRLVTAYIQWKQRQGLPICVACCLHQLVLLLQVPHGGND